MENEKTKRNREKIAKEKQRNFLNIFANQSWIPLGADYIQSAHANYSYIST